VAGRTAGSRGPIGFWYRLAVIILKPVLTVFTKRDWRGMEHLPQDGGVIVAFNHISYADPLVVAHYVYDNGRLARFLAKAPLFKVFFVGRVVTGAKQIPVHRNTATAIEALRSAIQAVNAGECLVIYPEGTATRDPRGWPMVAKTGVARLALTTRAPVIPVAQWGAQEILPYPQKKPRLLPRKTIQMLAGPPVDLSAYYGREQTVEVLREVTEVIMQRIREQVGTLRGEQPPADVFDPRAAAGNERTDAESEAKRRSA
jgi:1-acyl-sn-glycerol-3-phosphate acyltransferase